MQWEPGHADRSTSQTISACKGGSPLPSVTAQSQRILGEITCVDRDYMNLGERGGIWGVECILSAEANMLVDALFARERIPGAGPSD